MSSSSSNNRAGAGSSGRKNNNTNITNIGPNNQQYQFQQQPQQLRSAAAALRHSNSDNFFGGSSSFSQGSPNQLSVMGHDFSPEDIQDLLESVGGGDPNDNSNNSGLHPYHPHQHINTIHYGLSAATSSTNATTAAAAAMNANSDGNLSEGGTGGPDDKFVARTERKRTREKQRRSDVNKQFNDLTACLKMVEAEYDSEELRAAALPTVFSPSNRADLLARTVALLTALHSSNKRRKQEVSELKRELDASKQAGEEMAAKLKESIMAPQNMGGNKVMVMVPMMLGGDGTQQPHPMMNPWANMMAAPHNHLQQHQAMTMPPFLMQTPTAATQPHMQQALQPSQPAIPNVVVTSNNANGASASGTASNPQAVGATTSSNSNANTHNAASAAAAAASTTGLQMMMQMQSPWGMLPTTASAAAPNMFQQAPATSTTPTMPPFWMQPQAYAVPPPQPTLQTSAPSTAATISGIPQYLQHPSNNTASTASSPSQHSGKTDTTPSDPNNPIGSNLAHCA